MGDDKFHEYNKLKRLGEAAFEETYLVEHKLIKALWVMKQLDISAIPENEKEETLKNAKILQMLNHPNIVQIKDTYITQQSQLIIVMEYACGGDLLTKIEGQNGQLFPEAQILDWFTQICQSLKYLHDRKILHRDLAGQNIFFTKENQIKLGGFDLAIIMQSTNFKSQDFMGTPHYLSPEIIESALYSYSSDIWSLGVVLYLMCTLKPPFDADSLHFLALKILKGQYVPISSLYSKDLTILLCSMLEKNPINRPNINKILSLKFISKSTKNNDFTTTFLDSQNIVMQCSLKDRTGICKGIPCYPSLLLDKILQQEQQQQQQYEEDEVEQEYKYEYEYEEDNIMLIKAFTDFEDHLIDIVEVKHKISQFNCMNFEKYKIHNPVVSDETNNSCIPISKNTKNENHKIQLQVNQLRANVNLGLGSQNVDKALYILRNELLQKPLEEIEQENTKNFYQTLLPFLDVSQTKKYIVKLFQLVILMDQPMP